MAMRDFIVLLEMLIILFLPQLLFIMVMLINSIYISHYIVHYIHNTSIYTYIQKTRGR